MGDGVISLFQSAATSEIVKPGYYTVSQKSEPLNILQQQLQTCTDLTEILHTQDNIDCRHWRQILQEFIIPFTRFSILSNCCHKSQLPIRLTSLLTSSDLFTFQQESAPAHHARETIALLSAETPDFISLLDWPLNSPHLNPVDYAIWDILQERVYRCQIRDVDHLKERVIEEWRRFDQNRTLTEQ